MQNIKDNQIRNVIRDTRKNIRYIILAPRKLNREEMLYQIRIFNYIPQNLKLKPDTEVTFQAIDIK